MDKTPQIAEKKTRYDDGQSPRINTSKIKKVSISLFSADISKSEEISTWRPIDKTLHYDFSAINCHNFLSEGLTFFPPMGSKRIKTKHSPRLRGNSHGTDTHPQTDC